MKQLIYSVLFGTALASCQAQPSGANTSEVSPQVVSSLDDEIWVVFQDSKNIYWFGSNGSGVYTYDGEQLKLYTVSEGLVDNAIRGIKEDAEGNVYIETPSGVSKYDGKKFTTLPMVPGPGNEWKLEPTDLWFSCNASAEDVYRYDGTAMYELQLPEQDLKQRFGFNYHGLPSSPYAVFGLDKDKDGNLWIGTGEAGAFRYDGTSFLWFGEKELSKLPDGRVPGIRSMVQDHEGNFWLSQIKSRYQITSDSTYEKLPGMDLTLMPGIQELPFFNSGVHKDSTLWMATYGDGLWKYDGHFFSASRIENDGEFVNLVSIFLDNHGTLWLGTDNAGVWRQEDGTFTKFEPNL